MTVKSWRAAVRRMRLWGELDAELQTCETSNQDNSMYKDLRAVLGIYESPHLFEAPPITTTANIAINDSCNRDGCESMAHRNTQWMTEVAADHSLIMSQRDRRALLEGMLNWVISWMGEGRASTLEGVYWSIRQVLQSAFIIAHPLEELNRDFTIQQDLQLDWEWEPK
ncbi:hypothetical protein BU17DRAFT_63093 [Hysterangium stoloniferum]|nr:hypothetical protein BU17DRAFT_63093 [Hysterangium stoloniferum]